MGASYWRNVVANRENNKQTSKMDRFKKAAEHKVRQAMQVCLCAPSVVFFNFR